MFFPALCGSFPLPPTGRCRSRRHGGFYERVIDIGDDGVHVEPLVASSGIGSESISIGVATVRQVPDEEPNGSRVSTLLRQRAAFVLNEDVHFGQVTATSDIGIQVSSMYDLRWIPLDDLVCVVSPLFAVLMLDLVATVSVWPQDYIFDAGARVENFMAQATLCPRLGEVVHGLGELSEYAPMDVTRDWREVKTGRIRMPTAGLAFGKGGMSLIHIQSVTLLMRMEL